MVCGSSGNSGAFFGNIGVFECACVQVIPTDDQRCQKLRSLRTGNSAVRIKAGPFRHKDRTRRNHYLRRTPKCQTHILRHDDGLRIDDIALLILPNALGEGDAQEQFAILDRTYKHFAAVLDKGDGMFLKNGFGISLHTGRHKQGCREQSHDKRQCYG